MNIKLFKLVGGEEIVAELTNNDNEQGFVVKNPARIVLTDEGLGLAPLSMFAKDIKEVKLQIGHVVWIAEPEESIANAYNGQFGSGIILAKGGLI